MSMLAVRCGDCGQRVVQTGLELHCPDGGVAFAGCGNDPLTLERRDGPRYVEAVRGARRMRTSSAELSEWDCETSDRPCLLGPIRDVPWSEWSQRAGAHSSEMTSGIPEGWITR